MDQGSEFRGTFREMVRSRGLKTWHTGTEAHWQASEVEIHGKVWKEAFAKMCQHYQGEAQDEKKVARIFGLCNMAKNYRHRVRGFTPRQWLFGKGLPLPTSLVESGENLGLQSTMLGSPS